MHQACRVGHGIRWHAVRVHRSTEGVVKSWLLLLPMMPSGGSAVIMTRTWVAVWWSLHGGAAQGPALASSRKGMAAATVITWAVDDCEGYGTAYGGHDTGYNHK